MMRCWRWVLGAGCWVLVAGCADIRPPAPAPVDAAALGARLGAAPCVVASLLVKILPPDREGELVTVRLWSDAEGHTLVKGKKLDVDFLAALVQPDGSWRAWLPREGIRSQGRLGDGPAPQLLRDLSLLVDEVKLGPVPPGELRLDADGLPAAKILPGRATLTYARWADFDGLRRPTQVALTVDGDPARYEIRLKALEAPPAISAERLRLDVPAAVPEVAPAELAARLGG